jgi:hypothetical protein
VQTLLAVVYEGDMPKHVGVMSELCLGAFAKLRKAKNILVMSARPPAWEKLGSHWTNFHEIWYLIIFRKTFEKIQLSSKSDNNNRHFT